MKKLSGYSVLATALVLFVFIGLSNDAFASPESGSGRSFSSEVKKGPDRVPMAVACVGYGANWREANAAALAEAQRRFKSGFEVVGVQRDRLTGLVLPGKRYRVIIWAVPLS